MQFGPNCKSLVLSALLCLASGCDRALVYGDRTGLNLAIRSDPAKASPLEVNTGFQRQVVGFVPAKGKAPNGDPEGEAVNMVSRFDVKRTPGENGVFNDTVEIRSSFASGAAAIAAEDKPEAVAAITAQPRFVQSSVPSDRDVNSRLIAYVGRGPAQAQDYLNRVRAEGVAATTGADANSQALNAIFDPANRAVNLKVSKQLNL